MTTALILLSTYNGEKYLSTQLDSILSQNFTDWSLLIRDDGSKDATKEILKSYAASDSRITLLEDNLGNLNAKKSYSVLMKAALQRQEDFIFFSDQDDVWLKEKLSSKVSYLQTLQAKHGTQKPLLVHSDLTVVDKNLEMIAPSFLRFEKLQRNERNPLKTLLINNYVTGCALGMNRALLELTYPIPENVFMHDWWCALCAAGLGEIGFFNKPTILYRQHNNNVLGSKSFYSKLLELKNIRKSFIKRRANLQRCFVQAENLLEKIDSKNPHYDLINKFTKIKNSDIRNRYLLAREIGLKPASAMRAFVFWIFLGVV